MNIILLENIEKVGAKHDVVKVKDGFGRNYLIPQGKAIVANRVNLNKLDGLKKVAEKKEAAQVTIFKGWAAKISETPIKITAKAGDSGRLFGSVTAQHLAAEFAKVGVDVDKKIIEMPDEVKEVGSYKATVKFHRDVEAVVKFDVVAEKIVDMEAD